MALVIAVAGKGGTGKTTTMALLVKLLVQAGKGPVLAIDADPNSNLGDLLGVEVTRTIGSILDDVGACPEKVPAGMTKDRYIEYQVQESVYEGAGFDLLTMGKPEGPGCYCFVNNVLRNLMAGLIKEYQVVLIDNEAGLEHLSRRTTRRADVLLVVSDNSVVGLKAAQRINALAQELKIEVGKRFLLLNRSEGGIPLEKAHGLGLEYLGAIPVDKEVYRASVEGISLLTLQDSAPAVAALRNLGEKIWQK